MKISDPCIIIHVAAAGEPRRSAAEGEGMFNRLQPLFIGERQITDPLAIELAQYMNEDRALFVAHLRVEREYTWSLVAEECARAWGKEFAGRFGAGAALCGLASAYLGEDWDYLDTL